MKKLITLQQLSRNEINRILDIAWEYKRAMLSKAKRGSFLSGKTVAFYTTQSDDMAMRYASSLLDATIIEIKQMDNVYEEVKRLEAYGVSILVTDSAKVLGDNYIFMKSKIKVINLDNSAASPIAALATLATLKTYFERINNVTVAVLGNKNLGVVRELSYLFKMLSGKIVMQKSDKSDIPFVEYRSNAYSVAEGADAVLDIGVCDEDVERFYGDKNGIVIELLESAKVDAPLFFSRNCVNGNSVSEYTVSAVDSYNSYYLAVCVAVLYLMV